MYRGAIRFSETKWKQMDPDLAIELMLWINHSFKPGYMVHTIENNMCYFIGEFVGHTDLLFNNLNSNKFQIYNVAVIADDFYLEKTNDYYTLA